MNTDPNSICAPSGLGRTLVATLLTETTRTARAKDIFGITDSGVLALMSRGLSMAARIFDGIAEQRDRQAKQIIAFFGQDRQPDLLERQIGPAHTGKEPELKLGAWHWQ
jgi:hypothetical protein